MGRTIIGAIAVGALIAAGTLLPAGATAGGSNSNAPQDFVVGGGENNPLIAPINHFAISAHSGPNGENPFGEAHFLNTTTGPPVERFNGPVVCLRVSGNLASIIMRFRNTANQPPQFVGDLMFVQDNGDPVNGQPVDQVRNMRITSIPPTCPPPVPPGTLPLTHGNIQVHDAP
jgi:hypothetical protein